jgi:hypothetical protein
MLSIEGGQDEVMRPKQQTLASGGFELFRTGTRR